VNDAAPRISESLEHCRRKRLEHESMADKTDWLAVDRAQRGAAQTGGNDSAQRSDEGSAALHYEGEFVPLANAGDDNAPLTKAEIDAMVRNFQPRSIAEHIPVRFGRANSDGPVVARVSALRRDGATLSGKLAGVDPRFAQLLKSKKLGGRTARSMRFERDPEKGASLTGYGFLPPRMYGGGVGMHEGDSTDAGLTKLAKADSAGEVVQFSANDAGRVELIITDGPTKRSAAQHHGRTFPFDPNSVKLNDLAVARQREQSISFSEALSAVAAAHPELTVPSRDHSVEQQGETWRFQTNSERLSELATQRAREDKTLSFGEALSQVAAENSRLTLPDGVISCEEEAPKSNGQKLTDLAYDRAREDHISFGEALSAVAAEHPELTLPDPR
jgi:hypothetical protein